MRATSALLAVMAIVPTSGKKILKVVGAPAGHISTFVETTFKTDDGGTVRPDGVIIVERGKTHWSCLVEARPARQTSTRIKSTRISALPTVTTSMQC